MSQNIPWTVILDKLDNHVQTDQSKEEIKSDLVFIAPYYQFQIENLQENQNEIRIVEKKLFSVNQNFMVTRSINLNTLKIQSLQNIKKIKLFQCHQYQISDTKFLNYSNICASCDISGLILVWKIYIDKNEILIDIIMKGKFEDQLTSNLQIEWKDNNKVCTFNQNEISIWTFQDENQTKGPLHFKTQSFEGYKIQQIKFSQHVSILYAISQNSIIIMNSDYFEKIKEFKPYKKDKVCSIHIFKNSKQKIKDVLITISQKGIIKVWDFNNYNEEKKRYQIQQKVNIQAQSLQYKKTQKEQLIFFADFDLDQNLFFVLSQQKNQFILQIFQVNKSYNQEFQYEINQNNFFLKQTRYLIPGSEIAQLQITQIFNQQQEFYFSSECEINLCQMQEQQKIQDLVFAIYTVNNFNINAQFIQGENFEEQPEVNIKDIIQIEQEQNQKFLEQKIIPEFKQVEKDTSKEKIQKNQKKKQTYKNQKNQEQYKRERSKSFMKQDFEQIDNKTDENKNQEFIQEKNIIQQQQEIKNQYENQEQLNKIENQNFDQIQKDNLEYYISQKINQVFQDKNFTFQIESQIKQQIENSLKKEFQTNFQEQITPAFEKYLEKIFRQVTNTFEQGKDFYIDKINVEKQKYQNLEIQMNDSIKYFNKQSQTFLQFSETSLQNFNQIENKIKERETTLQILVEQVQTLQKNSTEQNQKLIEMERQLQKQIQKKNEEEHDQTINSQINQNNFERKQQFDNSFVFQQRPNERYYQHQRYDDPIISNLIQTIDSFKNYFYNQQPSYYPPHPNPYNYQDNRFNQSLIDKSSQEIKNKFGYEQNRNS